MQILIVWLMFTILPSPLWSYCRKYINLQVEELKFTSINGIELVS